MSCDREVQVALYAGGDLPAGEVDAVEQHLATCAECRDSLPVYSANCAALADAVNEIDAAAAAAVRHRVMSELRGGRTRWWPAWVGTAAALLVAIAIGSQSERAVLYYVPGTPAVANVVVPHAPAVITVQHHRRRPAQPKPVETKPEEPILVKLETDDPNIVIYWITD